MHLGNVFSALLAWLSARSMGGALVLRIEDLDRERCLSTYSRQLAEDLRWLGLDWDEGYEVGGPDGPYEQSMRTALYDAALRKLEDQGGVYPCYCSRAERLAASAPHRSDGQVAYDGRCRALTAEERERLEAKGRRPAYRLAVPDRVFGFTDGNMGYFEENMAYGCGDFLVRRTDEVYGYQLAVVVDDAAMGVTQVVRGGDLLDSTPRQLWLYELLGLKAPKFFHVPLLMTAAGHRLSKRERALDIGVLRERFTPEELVGILAFLAGIQAVPDPVSAKALIPIFDWAKVRKEDVVLDEKQFT